MSKNVLGAKGELYIDGALASMSTSVQISFTSGSKPMETIHGGRIGESPGSPSCQWQVRMLIPKDGLEYDPVDDINELKKKTFVLFIAGGKLKTEGTVVEGSVQHSVNDEAMLEFTVRGGPLTSE